PRVPGLRPRVLRHRRHHAIHLARVDRGRDRVHGDARVHRPGGNPRPDVRLRRGDRAARDRAAPREPGPPRPWHRAPLRVEPGWRAMSVVAVLGAGSWGTTLAVHVANAGHEARLWGRPEDDLGA